MALTKKEKEKLAKAAEERAKKLRLANKKTTSREEDLKIMARKTGNTNVKLKPETNEKKQGVINSSVGANNEPQRNNDAQGKNESSGSDSASGNIHNNSAAETANNNSSDDANNKGEQGAVSSDAKKDEETQQPKTDETPQAKPQAETVGKKELSLWDEVAQPTNEDKGIKEQIKNTSEAITNLAEQASDINNNLSELEAEEQAKKEGWKVKASITVELCDVAFMLICLLLTWDFDDENQKRFTLNSERKKAIQTNLVKIYALDNKKTNPKREMIFLIMGSYVPMLLVAVIMLINRLKNKQQAKQAKQSFNKIQAAAEQEAAQLRQQLEAERHKYETLNNMVKSAQPAQVPAQRPDFITAPKIGRTPKAPVMTGKGRGVKAGQKRGAYNKKK